MTGTTHATVPTVHGSKIAPTGGTASAKSINISIPAHLLRRTIPQTALKDTSALHGSMAPANIGITCRTAPTALRSGGALPGTTASASSMTGSPKSATILHHSTAPMSGVALTGTFMETA